MRDWRELRDELRAFALSLPEAHEDHPWGETVIKVNKKIFLFLGADEPAGRGQAFGVKLPSAAHGHALAVEGAAPSSHGLGRAGWVTVPFQAELPETPVLLDWVEESYRAVAPKRAVRALDERVR